MNNPKPDGLRIGGLLRCCTDTVYALYLDGPAAQAHEGQILQCKHLPDNPDHRMIFRAGAWEWLRET